MGCGVQLSAQPSICIYIYSQTGTFIYPEPPNTLKNCLNYEHYVVNYLFYGDLEGLGYIYAFLPGKKYALGGILTADCRIASS